MRQSLPAAPRRPVETATSQCSWRDLLQTLGASGRELSALKLHIATRQRLFTADSGIARNF